MREGVRTLNSARGTLAPTWAQSGRLLQGRLPEQTKTEPAQLNVNFRQQWTAKPLLSSETPWPWATKSPAASSFSSGKKRCSRSPPRAVSRTKM